MSQRPEGFEPGGDRGPARQPRYVSPAGSGVSPARPGGSWRSRWDIGPDQGGQPRALPSAEPSGAPRKPVPLHQPVPPDQVLVGTVLPPASPADGSPDGRPPMDSPVAGPRPGSRRRLAVVAALMVLLAALGTGGYLVSRPYLDQWPATLSTPDQLIGMPRYTNAALGRIGEALRNQLRTEVGASSSITAFYADTNDPGHILVVFGATTFLFSPASELDSAFRGAASGLPVSGIRDYPAGPMGGVVRCGSSTLEDAPTAVCAWADHGSLAFTLFVNRDRDESAPLLRNVRSAILHRG